MASVRRIVNTPYALCAEWEHPEELSRDWEKYFLGWIVDNHWGDFITEGDITVDIGAHTGDTSLVLGYLAKNCIAFEPNPDVFPILTLNADLNPDLGIQPHNCAITNKTGEFPMYSYSAGHCNAGLLEAGKPIGTCQGYNLEDFILGKLGIKLEDIGFIKIDTEGYDIEIFNSIPSILENKVPIFMEWFEHIEYKYFLNSIRSAGYIPYDPIRQTEIKDKSQKTLDVLCLAE